MPPVTVTQTVAIKNGYLLTGLNLQIRKYRSCGTQGDLEGMEYPSVASNIKFRELNVTFYNRKNLELYVNKKYTGNFLTTDGMMPILDNR